MELKNELVLVDVLREFMPDVDQIALLEESFKHFEYFHVVTLALQERGLSRLQTRQILDKLLMKYPSMKKHIGWPNDNKHTVGSHFENGILKILRGYEGMLSISEELAVTELLLDVDESDDECRNEDSDDDEEQDEIKRWSKQVRGAKWIKVQHTIASEYLDLFFFLVQVQVLSTYSVLPSFCWQIHAIVHNHCLSKLSCS